MDKELTKATEYKGVQLEDLDKETSMAHSAFFESNTGIEHFETLLNRDKSTLTPEQFTAISALNSVANMNYQICNGGLDQYYFNEYDKEREPYTKDDVKRLDKDSQVKMLRELQVFGTEVFPEREEDNARLERIISDFENSSYEEPTDSWSYEEEEYYEEGGLNAPYDFDERFYEVNGYLETLIEAYAQYLDKSIDLDLSKDERNTFYFSFGTSEFFPYKNGWVEVKANSRMEACELFSSHFPKRDGLINCSFIYSEGAWKDTVMAKGSPGQVCHQVIDNWGPHKQEKTIGELAQEARDRAGEKNVERTEATKDRSFPELGL